jgi:hypothetical protein
MCDQPIHVDIVGEGDMIGVDVAARWRRPIEINLPAKEFSLRIHQSKQWNHTMNSMDIKWAAALQILAHQHMPFSAAHQLSWYCQELMHLLTGSPLSLKSVKIHLLNKADSDPPIDLLFKQRGRHDQPDLYAPEMLLPYGSIADRFQSIVEKWLTRSEQAILAGNFFFGSQFDKKGTVEIGFLEITQAAESLMRSLDGGLYMSPKEYEQMLPKIFDALPSEIKGDHLQSIKSRLKFGNEHSLRRRLTQMFDRLPQDIGVQIAQDVKKFVDKVVNTRNYYTHLDHNSHSKALQGFDAYIAKERLRILVVASLLFGLGIDGTELKNALNRSPEYRHWLAQDIAL